jgi:hypothetical protein
VSELYCRNTERRSVHLERDRGTVPLKKFDRRLSLRNMRRSASRSLSRPPSWRRGRRSSVTRLLSQSTPRQSHGADGVDASQPLSTPSGSWRLSLKDVKASISARVSASRWAHDSKGAQSTTTTKNRAIGTAIE